MLYYTNAARVSAVEGIRGCISAISEVPGNYLSYTRASDCIKYLNQLIDAITDEVNADIKDSHTSKFSGIDDYKKYIANMRQQWVGKRAVYEDMAYDVIDVDYNGMLLINRPTQFNDTTAVKPNQVSLLEEVNDGMVSLLRSFMSIFEIKPKSVDVDELHIEYYKCKVNDGSDNVILLRDAQNDDIKHCDLPKFLEEPFYLRKRDDGYMCLSQLTIEEV